MNIENCVADEFGFRLGDIDEHFTGVADDVKEYGAYNNKEGAIAIYEKDAMLLRDEYMRQFEGVDLGDYDFGEKLEVGRVKGYARLEELFDKN